MPRPQLKSRGNMLSKDRYFSLNLKFLTTLERFSMKHIHHEMKISELKSYAEFATGIPAHMMRLHYLDEGDLLDHTDIKSNDIVPGGHLHMEVWHMWQPLVEAVVSNDIEMVFKLGVTQTPDFKTPIASYIHNARVKAEWIAQRAGIALYIAAHRGHIKLCEKLIEAGTSLDSATTLGRTALHVAASQGHGNIVDLLLEKGADINAMDHEGNTALDVAGKFGHKACERHLFLFRWQQRAKNTRPKMSKDLLAHQVHDSKFPVWLKGEYGQVYYTQILPPGEYQGTAFNAPRHSGIQPPEYNLDDEEEDYDPQIMEFENDIPPELDFGGNSPDSAGAKTGLATDGGRHQKNRLPESRARWPGMPAISEEATQSGTRRGLVSRESKPSYARDKSKAAAFARPSKKGQPSRPPNFSEWLGKKAKEEQIRITARKLEEEKKQNAVADQKLQDEVESQSYQQWLAEQEGAKKKGRQGRGQGQATTKNTGRRRDEEIVSYDSMSMKKDVVFTNKSFAQKV